MVLLNRKKIQPSKLQQSADLTEKTTWVINETGERITNYDSYLERQEFYNRNVFTCEVSGTDALSYFTALKSEEQHRKEVESHLSKELRKAIANYVNFNLTRRVSNLVDITFQRFSNRFFRDDIVCLRGVKKKILSKHKDKEYRLLEPQSVQCNATLFVVKDVFRSSKIIESEMEETAAPSLSLHLITECLDQKSKGSALIVNQNEIERPKSHFSKFRIACFLNEILIKVSNKKHAPWKVKQEYIETYDVSPKCPPQMVKYLPDELNPASTGLYTPLTIPLDEDTEPAVWEERPLSKMQIINDEISVRFQNVCNTAKIINCNSSKGTINDKELPFTGPSTPFKSICYLDSSLEYKTIDQRWYGECTRFSTERLLAVYQFLSSFGHFIGLPHFNFDQFLTTIKCTDSETLVDEYVKINFVKVDHNKSTTTNGKLGDGKENQIVIGNVSQNERTNILDPDKGYLLPSNFTRNQAMRNFIMNRSTEFLNYSIFKGNAVNSEAVDLDSYEKASEVYITIVCSLICLVKNEKNDWDCKMMKDRIEEKQKIEEEKTTAKVTLEKCLNHEKISWTKLLSRKNFKNGNWLICLLGILQQNTHVPTHSDIVQCFEDKVLPLSMNFDNLGEELWHNFRTRVSKKDKIDVLWVLVEVASNFSNFIKELVDGVPKLYHGIRSELDSAKKNYQDLKYQLQNLPKEHIQLYNNNPVDGRSSYEYETRTNELKVKMGYSMEDITYLEAQLVQSDVKRLEILGKDRNGNRFYWMDSNWFSSSNYQKNDWHYNCCYLWVQGPSEADVSFYLNVDKDSLKKWELSARENGTACATKEVFSIFKSAEGSYLQTGQNEDAMLIDANGILRKSTVLSPIYRKIISETPEQLLLSPDQWIFFSDTGDIPMLLDRLDDLGENERQLKKASFGIQNGPYRSVVQATAQSEKKC